MAIKGLLERFKKGLARTAQLFNIRAWFGRKVDQSFLDDLEARLDPGRRGRRGHGPDHRPGARGVRRQDGRREPGRLRQGRAEEPARGPQPRGPGRRGEEAQRLPDRRGQRLGQDDLDRQAGAAAQGPGQIDRAGRLRHLPRRRRRPARDLGQAGPAARSSGAPPGPTPPASPTTPASGPWPAASTS